MAIPQTIQMANLGMADSLILMVMALVVFGPRRLPQIGRQIGKLMYEFRKASNDFKFQMEEELRLSEDADRRKQEEDRQRAYAQAQPKSALPAPATTTEATTIEAAPIESSPVEASPVEYTSESMIPPPPIAVDSPSHGDVPRILPPSSGDPVEAQRPNRAYVPPQPLASDVSDTASEVADAFVAQAGIEATGATVIQSSPATPDSPAGTVSSAPADPISAEPEQAAHHA